MLRGKKIIKRGYRNERDYITRVANLPGIKSGPPI